LPSVEEAQRLIEAHRKPVEKIAKTDAYAECLEELKQAQGERRRGLEREREILKKRQKALCGSQAALHRAERHNLRAEHVATFKAIRLSRYESRPTGLARFLAKVTGLTLLRKKIHQYHDARALENYRQEQATVRTRQQEDEKTLGFRLKVQIQTLERRAHALARVEKRELAALKRNHRRYTRDWNRGEEGVLPSLTDIAKTEHQNRSAPPNLLHAFERAKKDSRPGPPDLMAAFEQAARERAESREGDRSHGTSYEKARPPEFSPQQQRDGRSRDEE
jgi:hypothetical protein